MTRDLQTPGITSVAALVYDHSGTARLSIDAKGPRELMNVDDKPEIVSILMKFVGSLSHDLGKVET